MVATMTCSSSLTNNLWIN